MSSLVRRILLLALAGGVLFDVLVPGNAAGLNAVIVMAAFLVAALLVAGSGGIRRMDPADAWLAPTALVLAALTAIRADDWLVTADLAFAAALAAGAIGCLGGGRITRGLVPQVLELAVGVVAGIGIGAASVVRDPRPQPAGAGSSGEPSRAARLRARLRGAAPIVRGLVIAVPIVALFVLLFAAADAVFARLASDVLAWKPDLDLADILTRSLVITSVAWGAAGLLAIAAGLLPAFLPAFLPALATPASATSAAGTSAGAPDIGPPGPPLDPPGPPSAPLMPGLGARTPAPGWLATTSPWPTAGAATTWPTAASSQGRSGWSAVASAPVRSALRLGATEAATVLLVVDLLFAAFVALQLTYLFGGRDTMALAGLTYAEYARRGFFELVLVTLLAGLLVVTLDLAVACRSRVQLGGELALLGLTGVVLISALVRLRLYQSMYGWTELRFVVLVAIGWLAVALAVAAGLLLTRRTRWILHVLGIMALVTLGGMNIVGPQAFVTERNLERAIDATLVPAGGRTGLDTDYLVQLGDEAVVPVVAAWDRLGSPDREVLAPALEWRAEQLRTDPTLQGWPAWNLTRERARAALAAWEAASP